MRRPLEPRRRRRAAPSTPLLLLAILPLHAAACDPSSPAPTAPSADASPSAAAVPPSPPPTPAAAPPDDLDVADLQKTLKCGGQKAGPCALLAKVAECKPWSATVPSGDGRWLGRASVVANGQTADGYAIFRLKSAPLSDVGPGQLPARMALAELTKDDGAAHEQADRTIRAYERGDVPPKSSPTLEHLRRRDQWPDAFAVRTRAGHVYGIAQGGTYICQGPKQQLLVVQRAATRASSGDGVYAELWATSW